MVSSSSKIIPANVVGNVAEYAVKGFDLKCCLDANGNLEVGKLQSLMNVVSNATIPMSLFEILNKAGHNNIIPSERITGDNTGEHEIGRPAKKLRVGVTYADHMAQYPENERDEFGRFKPIPPDGKWPSPFDRAIAISSKQMTHEEDHMAQDQDNERDEFGNENNGHELFDRIITIGGRQFYADGVFTDEEIELFDEFIRTTFERSFALGDISECEFLRIPDCIEVSVCETQNIGADCSDVNLDMKAMIAIYGLARKQADELEIGQPERWALLRMEAAKCGWFDHQPAVKRVPCNVEEMVRLFNDDNRDGKLDRLKPMAMKLCRFIPYFVEHSVRVYGSGFLGKSKFDFIARAHKLAASMQMEDCLRYMDEELLFGNCLRWIGVKRPMQVLRLTPSSSYVSKYFLIRAKGGSAGSAAITTALAVIKKMIAKGWWEPIKRVFDIVAAGEQIQLDPWKYHMYYSEFGVAPPNHDERQNINEAKEQVEDCAFVLQAYIETIETRSSLANARALKSIVDRQTPRFELNAVKGLFRRIKREGIKVLPDIGKGWWWSIGTTLN